MASVSEPTAVHVLRHVTRVHLFYGGHMVLAVGRVATGVSTQE